MVRDYTQHSKIFDKNEHSFYFFFTAYLVTSCKPQRD